MDFNRVLSIILCSALGWILGHLVCHYVDYKIQYLAIKDAVEKYMIENGIDPRNEKISIRVNNIRKDK